MSESFLDRVPSDSSLSLYVHVPYCNSKCSYCAFYSVTDHGTTLRYLDRVFTELDLLRERRLQPFETVFFGGGNPGLLEADHLEHILRIIGKPGSPNECTIEMNPESLRESHERLTEVGLTRLSVGIQSMNQTSLDILGRNVDLAENRRAIKLAKEMRRRTSLQFNCDLMTCIPGTGITEALADIDELVHDAEPDHISLYNLTYEEGTALAKQVGDGSLVPVGDDEQADILAACWEHLEKSGYRQYEVSNFSISPATRCRHNERYWRLEDYVGIGPAAAGTLSTREGAIRTSCPLSAHAYASSSPYTGYEVEHLGQREVMLELLLVGLRMNEGIDKRLWHQRFGLPFDAIFGTKIKALGDLCNNEAGHFAVSAKGFLLLDSIVLFLSEALDQPPPLDSEKTGVIP